MNIPDHLEDLEQEIRSSFTDGWEKQAAENQLLENLLFIEQALNLARNRKKITRQVLEEFARNGHDGANLKSAQAREKIAERIESRFRETVENQVQYWKELKSESGER